MLIIPPADSCRIRSILSQSFFGYKFICVKKMTMIMIMLILLIILLLFKNLYFYKKKFNQARFTSPFPLWGVGRAPILKDGPRCWRCIQPSREATDRVSIGLKRFNHLVFGALAKGVCAAIKKILKQIYFIKLGLILILKLLIKFNIYLINFNFIFNFKLNKIIL